MYLLKFSLTLIFCTFSVFIFPFSLNGQTSYQLNEEFKKFDAFYGLNSELINGIKFFPEKTNAQGNAFLEDIDSELSVLVINGKKYSNQKIQYDLSRQEFILIYIDNIGAENRIFLNHSSLDSVFINNRTFINSKSLNVKERYLELIYKGFLSVYFGYNKDLKFVGSESQSGYEFTKVKKTNYLFFNNQVYTFSSNKGFLKVIPSNIVVPCKEYLSQNKLNLKKANHMQIKSLMEFCNTAIISK